MKANRRRELLLKELNKELKIYLRAYDPSHPHYKRNIKNLYEGLMESGILMGIETSEHFKQFKDTFHKADKGLKLALITAKILDNTDLGNYYVYKGKPMHRIKMLGNLFVPKVRNPRLDEAERVAHTKAQTLLTNTIKDEQDLETIKQAIRDIKLSEEDHFTKSKSIKRINTLVEAFIHKYDVKDIEKSVAGTEIQEIETSFKNIDKILKKVSKIKSINQKTLTDLETAEAELIKNVKLRTDLEEQKIKNLTDILKVSKVTVEEDYKRISDEQINLVRGLTEVIDLRQQLADFLQFIDTNRVSLSDHWQVFRFKTKPQESDEEEEEEGNRYGDKLEGFEMKEFDWLIGNLQTYSQLFNQFKQTIPTGELMGKLTQINTLNNDLMQMVQNPESYFQRGDVIRNALGQITNIEEHELVDYITNQIQAKFKDLNNKIIDAVETCTRTIEHNENIVQTAKATRKTAIRKLVELEKIERDLARIEKRQTTNKEVKKELTADDIYELE